MKISRRASLGAVIAAPLALALGACSKDEPTATGSSAASGGGFPVTIKHALGEAIVKAAPKRIVALGQGSGETAIALGTIPVGIEAYPWGADESGHLPWIREAIEKKGQQLPTLLKGQTELDVEKVLELEPDLILAPWSGVTREQYDKLAEIAPTIAYAAKPWTTTWDDQITTIGKALGMPDEARRLIGTIDEHFAATAKAHPEFAKVDFSYIWNNGPGSLGIFKPHEQRVQFISKLGLKVDPVVNQFKETDGTASAIIGLENADKLKDSDLLFTFYMDDQARTKIEAQPLYAAIPAVKRGGVIAFKDTQKVTAMSMINPLTVPWVMDTVTEGITKALPTIG